MHHRWFYVFVSSLPLREMIDLRVQRPPFLHDHTVLVFKFGACVSHLLKRRRSLPWRGTRRWYRLHRGRGRAPTTLLGLWSRTVPASSAVASMYRRLSRCSHLRLRWRPLGRKARRWIAAETYHRVVHGSLRTLRSGWYILRL